MNLTELRSDRSCQRRTNWRFDVDPSLVGALSQALDKLGYPGQKLADRLITFRGSDPKLQVLCVVATGRVQVRVHPTVPEAERRHTAEVLYAGVCRTLLSRAG